MTAQELLHGYGHDARSRALDEVEGSFAYHLRRHRQQYGTSGISQRALAMIAHVSATFVKSLEASTELQGSVEPLLRVALALRQPVEALLSPARLHALRHDVEKRRELLGGDAELPEEPPRLILAVVYRSPYLLTALSNGPTVLELRQYRLPAAGATVDTMRSRIERVAVAYRVKEIVVEAGSLACDCVCSLGIPYRSIGFGDAKRCVAGAGALPSKPFFRRLLAAHPELTRYVKVLPVTGDVAMTEDWRTARLVAATLALAAGAAPTTTPAGVNSTSSASSL